MGVKVMIDDGHKPSPLLKWAEDVGVVAVDAYLARDQSLQSSM